MNILRRLWRRPELESDNPYVRVKTLKDTHELDMRWIKWVLAVGNIATLILLGIVSLDNYQQRNKPKEPPVFVMLDKDYEPIQVLARRADMMARSDPIRDGVAANFLANHIVHYYQRFLDDTFLADSLNTVRLQLAGNASDNFFKELNETKPFEKNDREKRIVKITGWPYKVSMGDKTDTWKADWEETVMDKADNVLGVEKRSGYFVLAQDTKKITTVDNFLGFFVVEREVP